MPKKLEDNPNVGELLHEWSIPEYEKQERPKVWYIVMGVFAVVLLAYSIISASFLFSLIIVLFAVIMFLHKQGFLM